MKCDLCIIVAGLCLLASSSALPKSQSSDQKVSLKSGASFVDEFASGQLDQSRWFISDGWNNGRHQLCTWTTRNVSVENGILALAFTNKPLKDRDYSCAEVQTKEQYGYGTYEARMQAVDGPGMVSAFFTYIGPSHGKPHDEIDFEFLGKSGDKVQLNYYVGGKGDRKKMVDLGFDASDGMHDYAFVWEPDSLSWYIDGRLVHKADAISAPLPQTSSKIFLSVWSGNAVEWLGRFKDPGKPLVMRVERIAFTARGDKCQFPDSIVCKSDGKVGQTP